MMLTATNVKDYLKGIFPGTNIYAGTINKNDSQCFGVYPRGRVDRHTAIGGIENTSHRYLSLTILVHWTESTAACEEKADELYEHFLIADNSTTINGFHVIFDLLDDSPVDLSRDERNICEMVIRLNILYKINQ